MSMAVKETLMPGLAASIENTVMIKTYSVKNQAYFLPLVYCLARNKKVYD